MQSFAVRKTVQFRDGGCRVTGDVGFYGARGSILSGFEVAYLLPPAWERHSGVSGIAFRTI